MTIKVRFSQTDDEIAFNGLVDFLASLNIITPEEHADRVRGPIIYKPGWYCTTMVQPMMNTTLKDISSGSVMKTLLEAMGDGNVSV